MQVVLEKTAGDDNGLESMKYQHIIDMDQDNKDVKLFPAETQQLTMTWAAEKGQKGIQQKTGNSSTQQIGSDQQIVVPGPPSIRSSEWTKEKALPYLLTIVTTVVVILLAQHCFGRYQSASPNHPHQDPMTSENPSRPPPGLVSFFTKVDNGSALVIAAGSTAMFEFVGVARGALQEVLFTSVLALLIFAVATVLVVDKVVSSRNPTQQSAW